MGRYRSEPAFEHDRTTKIGVLLTNLGTPDAPTSGAVRRYLAEFLSDPRVVEIPNIAWQPLLHGVVLRVRPSRSAAKYAAIWTNDGSPLLVHSVKQKVLLNGYLGQRLKKEGLPSDLCPVELGMRYGQPSIAASLDKLRAVNCEKILVLPLYPQYAASTTASTLDAVNAYFRTTRRVPALRFVDTFHDDAGYIRALAQSVNEYWQKHGRPDRLVLSFHGLPRRSLTAGDPYHCYCQITARLLADEIGLEKNQWILSFQSRFGAGEWLKPYTFETLNAMGRERLRRVDVFCPGFVADCLETLEEIAIEGRRVFQKAGGAELHAIPCLNEQPAWMAAMTDLAFRQLGGWLDKPPDAAARERTLLRARVAGAKS